MLYLFITLYMTRPQWWQSTTDSLLSVCLSDCPIFSNVNVCETN